MIRSISLLASMLLLSISNLASASSWNYQVTITNITKGQIFTPILAVTHKSDLALFELGEPASAELAMLAEGGAIAPLQGVLTGLPEWVLETNTNGGLLFPGESVSINIAGDQRFDRLSFAAMLIPTNDTFVALDGMPLPRTSSYAYAMAFDAGSESNDELCANIPGPYCMGAGNSPADEGEGYVYIGNGIRGVGDLDESEFDWNNPVAYVVIQRVK